LFVELTAEAGWDGATYQRWMAEMLTATCCDPAGASTPGAGRVFA
jgi:hypothetical protein